MSVISGQTTREILSEEAMEQRILQHLQGHWERRVQHKGVVTGEDVIAIVQSAGLPCEADDLRPLLADWNVVTYENLVECVATIRVTQNADMAMMLRHIDEDMVNLSPLGYLRYKLPCFARDPSWGYRAVKVSFHVAPRHMLFASTGVVLMITGMAILVLMSFLWLAQANNRESVQMTNFHLLLSSFTQSFEQRFFQAHAETMVDQVDTMAKLIEKQQEFREAKALSNTKDSAILIAQLLGIWAGSFEATAAAEAQGAMEGLRDLFNDNSISSFLTVAHVVAMVKDWNLPAGWETVAVIRTGTSTTPLIETAALECWYGTCDYTVVSCLQPGSTTTVATTSNTLDVQRRPTIAVALTLPIVNVTLCASISMAAIAANRMQHLVAGIGVANDAYVSPIFYRTEFLLVTPAPAGSVQATYNSPRFRTEAPCYSQGLCMAVDEAARSAMLAMSPLETTGVGYSGDLLYIGAAPTTFGCAVVVTYRDDALLESVRQELITVVDMINAASSRTTELSLGRRDATTGVINAQVNKFRFASSCLSTCARIDAAQQNAIVALTTQGSGYSITPDYRPAPVLGAYAYIGKRIGMSLVIERDVQEIRSIGLDALVAIFNDNNQKYSGTLEAQFVRYANMPPTRVYDRWARCDYIRECVVFPGAGAVYRSDCRHCLRAPDPVSPDVVYLTTLKMQADCDRHKNCSGASLAKEAGVARLALENGGDTSISVTSLDYRGINVLAVYSFIQNFSVALVVKLDTDEIQGPITSMIGLAIGTAIAIVLVGLMLLIFFSRKVLDKIEYEWLSYKEQIDQEKKKFDNMVKDVIPKHVADEISKGQKQAAALSNLCFVFLDVCNLSDKTKSWAPEIVCRYLTYIMTVVEHTARYYKLHKVRMFGDTYFAVGGLGDAPGDDHCTLRVARFAAVMVQLLSPKFAHYPDRIAVIRDTFAEVVAKNGPSFPDVSGNAEDVGHVAMPPMRIGIHYGSGTFCVIETGRTPTYEIFGPSVALAARMQATSQGNRIHLTGVTKEMIERYDKEHTFDFDAPRKTVVKGQGTVTSHFVNSASVNVPAELLDELGIEYANLRVFYEEVGGGAAPPPSDDTKEKEASKTDTKTSSKK